MISFFKRINITKLLFNFFIISVSLIILGTAINFLFAVGYLFALLLHEVGHYCCSKLLNIRVVFGGFSPFGAHVIIEQKVPIIQRAIIAIAGPSFNMIFSLICFIMYFIYGEYTFIILSYVSGILCILNLIPLRPLDGGYIGEAISPVMNYLGIPFLIYLLFITQRMKGKLLLIIILIIGIYNTYKTTIEYKKSSYFQIDRNSKIKLLLSYSILLAIAVFFIFYIKSSFDIIELIHGISKFKV